MKHPKKTIPIATARRVKAHRDREKQRGMKRVEVMVPAQFADELREFAADLRRRLADDAWRRIKRLVNKAVSEHHAEALDNVRVDSDAMTPAQVRIVAEMLMRRGGREAFLLGRELMDTLAAVSHAAD